MKKEIFEAQHLVEAKEEAFKKMNMKEENLVSIVSLRISAPMKMVLIR